MFPARASAAPSVSQRVDDPEANSGPAPFPSDQESEGRSAHSGALQASVFSAPEGRKVGSIPPTRGAGR